jgi:AIPR protein
VLGSLYVMCRIITNAKPEFITTVTINNNRQNPVEPWSLHANDTIQLELQDNFREELKMYYERQQGAFDNLSDEYLDEHGITETHKIELTLLARTFMISDGEIDKLNRFREVFEEDRIYTQVFNSSRVRADARKIVLCYKIQFRLRRLLTDILEKGRNRYGPYVNRARNLIWALLCQAALNDPKLEERLDAFGRDLRLPAQFTDWLSTMATTRCRFIVAELVADKQWADKVAEENFSFLRSNAAYKRAMEVAHKRWGWVQKRLNR